MTSAILFETLDSTREEIVEKMRTAIQSGRKKKLSRADFEELAIILAGKIIHLNRVKADSEAAVKAICDAEIQMLEEGYPQTSLNSKYLPIYTRQIKDAIAQGKIKLTGLNSYPEETAQGTIQKHFALDYLTYPKSIQVAPRGDATRRNTDRQEQQQLVDVDAFIGKALELLDSDELEDVAIALCAFTGMRHTEIVSSGSFEATEHPYTLRFEGQLKDPTPGVEILTLIPAEKLLPRLESFRKDCAELTGLSRDARQVQAFNTRVNGRVRTYFEKTGIVPIPSGFKTVSVHRLRGVYGAIAIHFFCPPTKNEHRFLQHYLGHLINGQNAEAFNAVATQHYFHFIAARDGKILGVKGVKLPSSGQPPLPAIAPSDDSKPISANPVEVSEPSADSVQDSKESTPQISQIDLKDLQDELQAVRAENSNLKKENAELKGDRHLLKQLRQILLEQSEMDQQLVQSRDAESLPEESLVELPVELPVEPLVELEEVAESTVSEHQISEPQNTFYSEKIQAEGRAQNRAATMFKVIQQWNQLHPEFSFAITQGLLVKTFHINQNAVNIFLRKNASILERYHHDVINVSTVRGHNRRAGRDVDQLKAFVEKNLSQHE